MVNINISRNIPLFTRVLIHPNRWFSSRRISKKTIQQKWVVCSRIIGFVKKISAFRIPGETSSQPFLGGPKISPWKYEIHVLLVEVISHPPKKARPKKIPDSFPRWKRKYLGCWTPPAMKELGSFFVLFYPLNKNGRFNKKCSSAKIQESSTNLTSLDFFTPSLSKRGRIKPSWYRKQLPIAANMQRIQSKHSKYRILIDSYVLF